MFQDSLSKTEEASPEQEGDASLSAWSSSGPLGGRQSHVPAMHHDRFLEAERMELGKGLGSMRGE